MSRALSGHVMKKPKVHLGSQPVVRTPITLVRFRTNSDSGCLLRTIGTQSWGSNFVLLTHVNLASYQKIIIVAVDSTWSIHAQWGLDHYCGVLSASLAIVWCNFRVYLEIFFVHFT